MRVIGAISVVLWSLGGLAAPAAADAASVADVRLNLELREAPLGEVTKHLAEKLGVSFELEPGVDPRTPLTATLMGVTLEQALRVVLQPAGLSYEYGDGVYTIHLAPPDARPDAAPDQDAPIAPSVLNPQKAVSPAGPRMLSVRAAGRPVLATRASWAHRRMQFVRWRTMWSTLPLPPAVRASATPSARR